MMAARTRKAAPKAERSRTAASARPVADEPTVRGQTLRLNVDAWRELKYLSVEQGRPAHDLLIEAVNDLLKKYKKRPLA